jgi:hypothetical protein
MKKLLMLVWLAVLCAWTGLVASFAQHHDGMVWRNLSPSVWLFQGVPLEATYTPSAVLSIQDGLVSISNTATSSTATITSVTTGNSVVVFVGQEGTDSSNSVADFGCLALTNATTVTGTRGGGVAGTLNIAFRVIQYLPQFIKSRQQSTITMTNGGSTTGTATITSVSTTKTAVAYGGSCSDNNVTSGNQVNATQARLTLTNATTVTATRNAINGTGSIVAFTALEFK